MNRSLSLALFGLFLLAPLAAAEPGVHVLEKGETLYSVARRYKLPYEAIAAANGIVDPAKLKAGQKLVIPRLHKVEKGETLYGIARSYAVGVEELRAANKLAATAVIKEGDVLFVPGGKAPAAAVASTPASGAGSKATGTASPASGKTAGGAVVPSGAGGGASASAGSPSVPLPPIVKTSARAVDGKLSWPCSGEASYLDGKLFGILIRTRSGEPSLAVASGTVVSAGPYRGFGQVAFVQSKNGHVYVYGGNEELAVGVGDRIRAGQELGRIGLDPKEGRAVAYFFVFKGGEALDPATVPRD
ncbi:MAG: LysM peptidoglycan-binding domain-containing protein [Spirochaetaceae bacterium]|nr:LysM peptidoglycan-binding domain-containing protein [Spirochaetaceae bacterium]